MELRRYLEIWKRRKWVALVTMIVTVAIVGLGSYIMTPVYSASAVVRIAQIQDSDIGYYDLNYSERLMNTYTHLLDSRLFLEEVIQRLGLNLSPKDLTKRIKVETLANTELLKITAESTNPRQAMEVANTLGTLLLEQRENLYSGQGKSAREILEDQLSIVEENLAGDRARLQSLFYEETNLEQEGTIQDLNTRIRVQEQTYAMLLNEYEQARLAEAARANSVSIVDPAITPDVPIKPRMILNIILGVFVGSVGGMGLAFLFENLDLAIYSADDLESAAKSPLLGSIPHLNLPSGYTHRAILLKLDKQSAAGEAFTILRTNLHAFISDKAVKKVLITSAEQGVGKSTVLANLAIALALTGRRVVVVDSNLRNPCLHETFSLGNEIGLSTMIKRPSLIGSAMQLANTKFMRVRVLTSGPLPPNPAEVIGSLQMQKILAQLVMESDLVLLDSPAILTYADAATLAPMVDGVVLVAARGETTEANVQKALEQLEMVRATLIGVVFNKVDYGDGG